MNPEEKPQEKIEKKEPDNFFNSLKTLRTFQGDVEQIMGVKKTSIADIAIAEQKRKEKEKVTEVPQKSFVVELKNKSFLTFGIELFIGGLLIVAGVYYILSIKPVVVQTNTIVNYSKKVDIATDTKTGTDITRSIVEQKSFPLSTNAITYIHFTEATSSTDIQKLFTELAPHAPASLVRTFGPEYMFGIYSFDTNEPFVLLSVTDFGPAYSGMLAWEKSMPADLTQIFSLPTQNASSTYALTFTDESIRNKDLRVVRDQNRKVILLYSFLDKNTLLMTTHEDTFTGLLSKFGTSKVVR